MIDHFLGNTTRLNLPPSTEFYIDMGRVRKTWLFFKLRLKKVGSCFFSLIIEFITKSRASSYVPSYVRCFSFQPFRHCIWFNVEGYFVHMLFLYFESNEMKITKVCTTRNIGLKDI